MRERIARFMAGRYGTDRLNRFLLISCAVFMLLAAIFRRSPVSLLFWFLSLALIVTVYLRMLSRNRAKRAQENTRYLRACYNARNKLRMLKERWVQRKDYKFFTCPSCKTTLRVPRGKGKVNIVCRKCGNSFQGKT